MISENESRGSLASSSKNSKKTESIVTSTDSSKEYLHDGGNIYPKVHSSDSSSQSSSDEKIDANSRGRWPNEQTLLLNTSIQAGTASPHIDENE